MDDIIPVKKIKALLIRHINKLFFIDSESRNLTLSKACII